MRFVGGEKMKIPVLFLLKIREYLPEFLRQELDEIMLKCREAHKNEVRKCREFCKNEAEISCEAHSEAHRNEGKICEAHTGKNGEICSKTAFSAQNCEAHTLRGGEGGVLLYNNSTSNSVTEDDVTSTISLKEKNIKKRKKICEAHSEAHKNASEKFSELYEKFPRKKGKAKGLESLARMEKKGELPGTGMLLAALEIDKAMWEREDRAEDKIPYFSSWVNAKSWEDVPLAKLEAYIASMKAKEAQAQVKAWEHAVSARPPAEEEYCDDEQKKQLWNEFLGKKQEAK
jgi:hypothetical protein